MNLKKVIKGISCYLLIIIASVILSLTNYLKTYFYSAYFEQLLYNLIHMKSLNPAPLAESITYVIWGAVILIAIFSIPLLIPCFIGNQKWIISFKKKKIQLFPVRLSYYAFLIFGISIFLFILRVGFPQYLWNQFSTSDLYEKYYVSYQEEKVTFPGEKRNLIYIYLESFESSVFDKSHGGTFDESLAPNLEKLAEQYTNFSNTDKIGGFRTIKGTNWTAAAMVAQTAGVPIYINSQNKEGHFLKGVTSLGEILLENDYQNYLMIGSNADFADKRKYFSEHGDYQIFDYMSAKNYAFIPYDYFIWWGYEDSKLYEFAKNQLLEIAKEDQPFNFTILTADTHYFNGYLDKSCPSKFSSAYANSFYCADRMLADFLKWIQEQDFYENTTVIIVGDHLTMRDDFFDDSGDYERTIFNLFIHSAISTDQIKNRDFTAFDMFPTTLASLGASIEGNRLGFGTNLFSDQVTLSEEIGYEKFSKEIQKRSNYYQNQILMK